MTQTRPANKKQNRGTDNSFECNTLLVTHVIHSLQLLPGDRRPIVEHEGRARGQSGHVTQPDFEEADLDEDQLVVLAQIAETGNPFREFHHPLDTGRYVRGKLLP